MPTFATPQPITATVEIVSGSVHLTASDRDDTVVTVSPRDPNRASDVRVAESARVDFTNGTLTVTAGRRIISLGRGGAVTVDIELPSRSRLQVSSASAKLRADGDFGDCRLSTASGDASIESVTGNFKSDSASGAISVDVLTGRRNCLDRVGRRYVRRTRRRRQVPGGQRVTVGQAASRHGQRADRVRRHHHYHGGIGRGVRAERQR